jgi:hypothetical protein
MKRLGKSGRTPRRRTSIALVLALGGAAAVAGSGIGIWSAEESSAAREPAVSTLHRATAAPAVGRRRHRHHLAPFSPVLHPNGPKETCPEQTLPLPGSAIASAVNAAFAEAPQLFPKFDLTSMRADSAIARRSDHVKVECGHQVEVHTVTVELTFPAYAPKASVEQHTVLVASFATGYHVWYVLH